jgi:uncharacterized membrane protein YqgA involved in biofilm formation
MTPIDFLNTATVLYRIIRVEGDLPSMVKGRPERVKTIVMQTLGLSTLLIGLQMALSAREVIPVVALRPFEGLE